MPYKIYYICTGNSCRSQMAEGFTRYLGKDLVEVRSAGLEPSTVHPRAISSMLEKGIDISNHTSDSIDQDFLASADIAITLCGDAQERCPVTPPSVLRLHWPLIDPAKAEGTEEEIMEVFRTVRDQIEELVKTVLSDLSHGFLEKLDQP